MTPGESANAASAQAIRDCQADGVAFSYPPGWHQESSQARATITSRFRRQIPGIFRQGGGAAQTEPRRITVGGLLALKVRGTGRSFDGAHIESTLVFAFDGKTEYFIDCQHTQHHAAQVKRACDQILSTFRARTTR